MRTNTIISQPFLTNHFVTNKEIRLCVQVFNSEVHYTTKPHIHKRYPLKSWKHSIACRASQYIKEISLKNIFGCISIIEFVCYIDNLSRRPCQEICLPSWLACYMSWVQNVGPDLDPNFLTLWWYL